jgi:large subunit ribosomal protein L17
MRHKKAGRRLGRTTAHRSAMMKNMAAALFTHNAIETTLAKGKELRGYAEPLITLAKRDNSFNRRRAFAALRSKHAVNRLFNELGPAFSDRAGWYTRILKLGQRHGDNAQMARVELVGLGEYVEE